MEAVSWFRGAGGEMVRVYVSPLSYLSAIPIAVLVPAITAGCAALGDIGIFVAAPIIFLLYVLFIMRIAVPATQGRLNPSNDFGELIAYTGRYAAVTLAWLVPVAAAVILIFKSGEVMLPMPGVPVNWEKVGFLTFCLLVLFLVAAFLPTLSLLVVLRHDSLRTVLSAAGWRWLLVERQEDLLPFYTFLFGGAFAMAAVSLVPAAVIIFITLQVSPESVGTVSGILYLWSASTMPILTGLMAGAFVAGESMQKPGAAAPVFTPDGPTVPAITLPAAQRAAVSPVSGVDAPAAPAGTPEPRPDVRQIEQRLGAVTDDQLEAALASASDAEATTPLLSSVEKTLLSLRSGNRKGAVEAASKGAGLAVQRGFTDVAVFLFTKLGEDRMKISAEPQTLDLMGKLLEQRLLYIDGAWCYHTAALKAGDPMKAPQDSRPPLALLLPMLATASPQCISCQAEVFGNSFQQLMQ